MARRRYQRGHLRLRGKRAKVWVAMWREDVIAPDGTTRRIRKSEVLGTLKEYKTRRLAERALEQRLSDVNSLTYKPRPTATFSEFAKKWQTDVLSQHKRSTQSADKSRIRKHLDPELGTMCMKAISRELLQAFVARKATILSAKSVRNLIALLGEMWVSSKGRRLHAARPLRESRPAGSGSHQRAMPHAGRDAIGHRQRGGALQNVLLDPGGDRDPVWRSVRFAGAELTARCWSNQNRAESLAREDRNGEVEKGQSSLRNFSATRGASAPIPSHLAIEPARFALRHGQRNAVGRGSRSEAETLSPAREARDRALRVPCFSPRERDRDGRRGCSDGDSTESPRSLRCAHDDEIYTRDP
jgi:Phage integrase, N-terminal SAM-like domain